MGRADSLKTSLMLGNIEGRRRKGQQRMRWLDGIIDSLDVSLSKLWKIVKHMEAWSAVVHGVANNQTQLNDRTRSFMVSCLMLKSLSHFGFTFVHDMSVCSNVIDLPAEAQLPNTTC